MFIDILWNIFAERADAERTANQAQALWAACQALWASVRAATPGVHYKDRLRPLKNEINAIAKVASKLKRFPHFDFSC